MTEKKTFHIIQPQAVGDAKETTTLKGVKVVREEKLFIEEWGAFVTCAPYDDHFIYLNPDISAGSPAYMCTCGSTAGVVPPGPTGMFVCLFHAENGYHTTSVLNKKDFLKDAAGQTLSPKKKGTKWI